MKTIKQVKTRLAELQADDMLKQPTADIETNAVLALLQLELETKISTLKWALKETA